MKRTWTDIIAIVCIVAVVALFFSPIAKGKVPVPTDALVGLYHPWRDFFADAYPRGIPYKNFLITDPIRQQIPWRKIAIDQWKSGNIPSWNPYNFSGSSLAGNIQAAAFYPFNILFAFLDFPGGWTMLIILEPLLAAIFLYAYLRTKALSPLSSVFGALSWSFSGFMIAWLTWGTLIHVVLWMPLILLSIDKLRNNTLLWSIVLVAALTFQMLAGHAQLSLYILLVTGVYALWRRANFFWILLLISLAITSIQWTGLIRSVLESSRIGSGENWYVAGWFLPWQHLIQFLAPDFFGNPATLNYWGEWNYGEFIGYISVVGIIFALHALLVGKKSPYVTFWGWILASSFVFILPTPIAKLPFLLRIPIVSALQPTRLMSIVDFSLVALAAFGYQQWQERKDKRIWFPIIVVGSLLGILWVLTLQSNLLVSRRNLILPTAVYGLSALVIAGASNPRKKVIMAFAGIVLIVIVAFDLIRFGWKFTPFTPREYFFPQTSAIEFLERQEKPFRVLSTDPKLLPPNVAAYYGIEDVSGYDPIVSNDYEAFVSALSRGKPDISPPYGFNRIVETGNLNSPLVRLLNVRYVLSLSDISDPRLAIVHEEGDTKVYEFTDTLPRVYLVSKIIVDTSRENIIKTLYDPTFDPTTTAVVAQNLQIDDSRLSQDEVVHITNYSSQSMKLEVTVSQSRFLVIGNRRDPRWHVYMDEVEVPTVVTNFLFFGIVVPVGTHTITVQYR
ncbi:YfhO family protein [Candidatus Gottesmanbacteria bacterium]|nr:YfhO family protein [Candidatus Gottesmanbacteria bacterium]